MHVMSPVVGLVEETLCELKTFLNCFFSVQPEDAGKLLCLQPLALALALVLTLALRVLLETLEEGDKRLIM